MDFQDQVGTELSLLVRQRGEGQQRRIGFGAEFQNFDQMLWDSRTSAEVARDDREFEDWDYFDRNSPRRGHYGSMRIYHISGQPAQALIVGDAWKVVVVKCYLNPNEPPTRDNRRKIHFSVKLLKRLETIQRLCLWDEGAIRTRWFCGNNQRGEKVPCEIRSVRYMIESTARILDVRQPFVDGVGQDFFRIIGIQTFGQYEQSEQRRLGKALDVKRVQATLRNMPAAPDALIELYNYGRAA